MRDHFTLETRGHCLFCLKGGDMPNSEEGKGPSFSFRGLLKYLQIDLFSILGKETPPQTLKLLRGCDPKGTLCVKCEQLLDELLKLLEELELVQLKLNYYLKLTKEEVENSFEDEIELANQMGMKVGADINKNLVERFRKEIVSKCTVHIDRTTPQVILKRVDSSLDEEEEEQPPQKVEVEPVPNLKTEIVEDSFYETDDLIEGQMELEKLHLAEEISSVLSGTKIPSRERDSIILTEGKLKYQCDKCNKVYSNEHTLTEHRRAFHEGIKFKCFLCPYTCSYSSAMTLHKQRVHQGGFHRQRNPLVKDDRILTSIKKGVKKFKCSLCENKFTLQSSLDVHRRSVHLGIRFPCRFCGKLFTQKGQVNIHIKRWCRKKPI